jgi:YVTN family beta-propeller protein
LITQRSADGLGTFKEIQMQLRKFSWFALAASLAAAVCTAQVQQNAAFHLVRTIELGGTGGWDYLTFDPHGDRLFISRATRVIVVDLSAGKLAGEIPDTAGVHGIALIPEIHRGVTTNGKANTASIFDLDSLGPVATVSTGEKPDAILWEPVSKTVFAMNAGANTISMIDVQGANVVDTIALPGRPESAASDERGKVFVNLEDKAQISAIDIAKHAVVATWDLAGCTEPTGIAMDREHQRLFSGCHNGVLVVVDARSGKNIQKVPIGLGVDAVAYDPQLHTIFTSNKEGSVSIIDQVDADTYRNRETVTTLPGAKTMALDPVRHVVYTVGIRNGLFVLLEIASSLAQ